MGTRPPGSDGRRSAFTLVELALASFLVAVGLLGVYALLRTGMDSASERETDVRGSLFAHTAFATLDAAADVAAMGGATNWVAFWEDFFDGSTNLPLPGAGASDAESPSESPLGAGSDSFSSAIPGLHLRGDGLFAYVYADATVSSASNTVWYEFNHPPNWLRRESGGDPFAVAVTLHVWPERPTSSAQTYFRMFSCQVRDATE